MNTNPTNPYVGPRTFLKNESHLFFGRDREARDLFSLVNSEKLVLFYAQSGAGKSSLINTRLIPNLEAKNYEVLRVGRVGGQDYPGIDIENIYVFNLLRSLTQQEVQPEILARLDLNKFLAGLKLKKDGDENEYFYDDTPAANQAKLPQRRVLIIDQFEEIFSTHPEAWNKREDFFDQAAQAMENDLYLWVVLVMREDYIAALDPYAHLVAGGLRTRYYMQRLGQEASIQAVRKPVENFRPYEPNVAEKLVADLSSIKVQKPNGTQEFQPGQYVEPVQLQVVCYGLWQNLPSSGTSITEKDLLEVGDVNEALGKYYAGRVAGVAETKHVKERLIREWIERKLIAPGGIRGMVLQETNKKSGEISDDVIQALQSDLVRAENRGGAMWYELTHDRLIAPILNNNKKWFDQNLSPLQRQAALWNDQERNERWLLRDQALTEVDDWARANPDELSGLEKEFLEACHKQQDQIKLSEQARSARRLQRTVAGVGLLALIAVFAAVSAFRFGQQASSESIRAQQANTRSADSLSTARVANTKAVAGRIEADIANATAQVASTLAVNQANKALSGSLAAQADSEKNVHYDLALLLGIEGYKHDPNLLTRTTLFQLLQFTPYQRAFGFDGPVSSVAVSSDGSLIAAASCRGDQSRQCTKGSIKLYDANMNEVRDLSALSHDFGPVHTLVFSPDNKILAAGGCAPEGCDVSKGQITLWGISDPVNPVLRSDTLTAPGVTHSALVKTIAFSPNGNLLASGSYDTTIILWDITDPVHPLPIGKPLRAHSSFVNSLAFSFDGKTLVSASDDKTIRFWNVTNPKTTGLLPVELAPKHSRPVNSIAFSRDGTKFASSSDDNSVFLWTWDSAKSPSLTNARILKGHTGYVKSIAFNQDGTVLASTGFDNKIILWDTSSGEQIGPPLSVHSSAINSVAFGTKISNGKDVPYLISGSDDRTIIQWNLSIHQPLSHTAEAKVELPLDGQDQLNASNGRFNASASGQQVDVMTTSDEKVVIALGGFESPVRYVEFDGPNLRTMDQNQFDISVQKDRKIAWTTSWSIDPLDWVGLACKAIGRNLTASEWKQFLQNEPYRKTCENNP